jgi:hypothetical protein
MTMMRIQSQIDTVILSLGAPELYGESTRIRKAPASGGKAIFGFGGIDSGCP